MSTRYAGGVADSLTAWLREVLSEVPPGPVEVETNLEALDEAGRPSPDFDWIQAVVREFPQHQARVIYRTARTREEAIAPYEVCVRSGGTMRRAWVEIQAPGRWAILDEE